MNKGRLTVITGPMYSGKTSKLISIAKILRRLNRTVVTLKPAIDSRYSADDELHTHDHQKSPALLINGETADQILALIQSKHADTVIIDEAQFFDPATIMAVITELLSAGITIYAAGLLYDYKRQPFGAVPTLLGRADEAVELVSVCQKCGALARHSERTGGGTSTIDVGSVDKYIAVCLDCHAMYQEPR